MSSCKKGTLEQFGLLKRVLAKDGVVTAATSSPLSDGVAILCGVRS